MLYRMRPDGSHLEYVTHGQVNPFGLAFDPLGNLYSTDCHTKPIMMLLRGGYYESFGKPHDGLGFAPEICPNYAGSTAIAGIAYYAADHFPPKYRDTAFIAALAEAAARGVVIVDCTQCLAGTVDLTEYAAGSACVPCRLRRSG